MSRTGRCIGALGLVLCATSVAARGDVVSDQAAAILVVPKIVVDVTNAAPQIAPPHRIDTLIRVSNTLNAPIRLYCFYVNATPHCTSTAEPCVSNPDMCSCLTDPVTCPRSFCKTEWNEIDFRIQLTAQQPIAWLASQGASFCSPSSDPDVPCLPLSSDSGVLGPGGQSNDESLIPPVPEDPFIGELKCIAVDRNTIPIETNNLKAEVEIVRSSSGFVDVEGYNAIGIPAIPGTNNQDNVLVLGGPSAEYSPCPNLLIMDHFFDGALDPVSNKTVTTDLTLVPCSEDFATQVTPTSTVQFLIFNEFEQRLSTSRSLTCFQEIRISDIDNARPGIERSIFSAAVQGTLTGQTRIRGVADGSRTHGNTLLGVAEEFRDGGGSAAVNLHFDGSRPQSDFIYLPGN